MLNLKPRFDLHDHPAFIVISPRASVRTLAGLKLFDLGAAFLR
ncbi:MAG: hypothetical protein WBX25_29845 [Rhodomicrobium sp.]